MGRMNFLKLHWLLSGQFGFAPRVMWSALRELPRYVSDWRQFRKGYKGSMRIAPCLHDRLMEGGSTKSEYFWQDLLVARWIFDANPTRHVDIGSRVDGFISHVASFRNVEVIDIRPIQDSVPGIIFRKGDVMRWDGIPDITTDYCDSLSCLHALEHFGLGRYGDAIDPCGYKRGLANMVALLKPGGTFYLSIPIGEERVEFNAHRVFDPVGLVQLAEEQGLVCQQLTVISTKIQIEQGPISSERLKTLSKEQYNLGIFTFRKSV